MASSTCLASVHTHRSRTIFPWDIEHVELREMLSSMQEIYSHSFLKLNFLQDQQIVVCYGYEEGWLVALNKCVVCSRVIHDPSNRECKNSALSCEECRPSVEMFFGLDIDWKKVADYVIEHFENFDNHAS